MPALSFQEEWVDKLLRSDKQQTTRAQTDRIKVGDVVHVYNQQRRRVVDKEVRTPTEAGIKIIFQRIDEGRYPKPDDLDTGDWTVDPYYAHFLGKVEITEVYDIIPSTMSGNELEVWAMRDGFDCYGAAYTWFESRYDDNWMEDTFTVIRWNGWQERYFEPEAIR